MMPGMSDRLNLHTPEFTYDDEDPPGYRGGAMMISKALGAKETSLRLFELPPGESLCPYHYEYVEEWLLLHSGELDLRTPAGTERLASGAVACFPAGPDGAHKVTTPDEQTEPSRFVMFSSTREPSVAVYPDGDKIGVWVPGGADNVMLRRESGSVPYYDGETG
jgi:uncharacterized cupin superfamily protein